MGDIFADYDVLGAVWVTIQLSVLGTIGAMVLGTIIAVLRVSPVAVLRGLGTSYVNTFRNLPLTLLMVFSILGLSFILQLSVSDDFARNAFWWAAIMLAVYHAAYVCEALRSGVNTVPVGQAEAARSIGLAFGQSMREVILPQAFRGSIAPLGSVVIALIKNSTVAAVIGVGDSAGLLQVITENEGASLLTFFFFAMVFVVLTLPIGLWTTSLSRKLSVKR
ncbi:MULTISPECIES: amino acid ABC transporter permease [Dietzia]|jgi:glutamate transport system permease protein|uniref:Amino acid ABC transporter permease n=2 Tax=Dietzia TaxID=37914 RepID=A0A365P9T5_9ACTN|nr:MULTISPECIES: amino acid ABC transporter permease [Dietzia]MBB0990786.1 amino acid ABC transporter permease [Dietzia sp. SLG510A3-30A2]MBB0994275.1 amino acid ABC transporter permease [Dietzia sp. SLG510A3-40A3]MBB1008664.1 amino acid ABC transporter permease [Dietzia sp. SLG510A3-3B2-2]MVZ91077.1 ABC transporter permease subunit [Microbacter sp. ANSKLAB05]ODQ85501.1 glutamate ABC transporter permease [Dietzia alimentaria]HBD22046.1 amino acid ABC transporter permease [Dietzia sp.]